MCLELYAVDQPVQIAYEEEIVRFVSPFSMVVRIMLLVRNTGYRPVTKLNAIYPHYLFKLEGGTTHGQVRATLPRFRDITDSIHSHNPAMQVRTDAGTGAQWLSLHLPDPNYPLATIPLEGRWALGNVQFEFPAALTTNLRRAHFYFRELLFSPFVIALTRPILPLEAHWLRFEVEVDRVGAPLSNTLLGHPLVFHEVVSPIDVRRTTLESVQTSLRKARESKDPDDRLDREVLEGVLDGTGLLCERRVDLQYFELTIEPGDPMRCLLLNSVHQGDLRMRAESPQVRVTELPNGTINHGYPAMTEEPVYQWKSGSTLEPAHPWKNSGFSLRFTLVHSDKGGG